MQLFSNGNPIEKSSYSVPVTCLKPLDCRNSWEKVELVQLFPALTVVSRLAKGASNTCLRHPHRKKTSPFENNCLCREDGRCQKETAGNLKAPHGYMETRLCCFFYNCTHSKMLQNVLRNVVRFRISCKRTFHFYVAKCICSLTQSKRALELACVQTLATGEERKERNSARRPLERA